MMGSGKAVKTAVPGSRGQKPAYITTPEGLSGEGAARDGAHRDNARGNKPSPAGTSFSDFRSKSGKTS